jgi:hypothetical protein
MAAMHVDPAELLPFESTLNLATVGWWVAPARPSLCWTPPALWLKSVR